MGGTNSRELVVLTHGFMANRLMLHLLAARLRRLGWNIDIWGYESLVTSVKTHAHRFSDFLTERCADNRYDHIHLVTHSMGCIIGRMALNDVQSEKIMRFVMLTPPNHGSFVATRTAKLFGYFFRPVAELTTEHDSLVNSLADPANVEIGVIAAEQDVLVSLESTRLGVPHEHITLPCLHSAVLFRQDSANHIHSFLKTGHFQKVYPDTKTAVNAIH